MRRSRGQVFVLARDKVADSHTRGSHWRKMHKIQLMSALGSKETMDGKLQLHSCCKRFLATCVFSPTFKYKQEAGFPPISTIPLPSVFSQGLFSLINTVPRSALRLVGLQTRCLLWFSAAHVSYCATPAADAARRWKSKLADGDAICRS